MQQPTTKEQPIAKEEAATGEFPICKEWLMIPEEGWMFKGGVATDRWLKPEDHPAMPT